MTGNHRYWTKADDDALLRLRREGLRNADVAAVVDRTCIAVQCRLSRLKSRGFDVPYQVGGHYWLPWQVETVRRMSLDGAATHAVAEAIGRSVNAVWLRVAELRDEGLLPPRARKQPASRPTVSDRARALRRRSHEASGKHVSVEMSIEVAEIMRGAGAKDAAIARALGLTRGALWKRLQRHRNHGSHAAPVETHGERR